MLRLRILLRGRTDRCPDYLRVKHAELVDVDVLEGADGGKALFSRHGLPLEFFLMDGRVDELLLPELHLEVIFFSLHTADLRSLFDCHLVGLFLDQAVHELAVFHSDVSFGSRLGLFLL